MKEWIFKLFITICFQFSILSLSFYILHLWQNFSVQQSFIRRYRLAAFRTPHYMCISWSDKQKIAELVQSKETRKKKSGILSESRTPWALRFCLIQNSTKFQDINLSFLVHRTTYARELSGFLRISLRLYYDRGKTTLYNYKAFEQFLHSHRFPSSLSTFESKKPIKYKIKALS